MANLIVLFLNIMLILAKVLFKFIRFTGLYVAIITFIIGYKIEIYLGAKYGSIYEKIISPLDKNQYVYIKIASSEGYNATKEYYRLEEPLDVNLSDYSISNRWSGIKVNRENSGGTINYDPNSGITDSGQTITLIELTSNILLNLINEVEQE